MKTRLIFMTVLILGLLALAGPAYADGIIIPEPPICIDCPTPPPPEPVWLTIKYHRVNVTIEDQVAVTHVDQVFVNESPWQIEGTYVFPLPADAAVSDFAMWVDGVKFEGEILDRDQARRIYEDIVRQQRDPALLEYIDRGAFRLSIFPIPAGAERRIELEYSQVLPVDGGLVRYVYPLDTERFSARPIEDVSVSVEIASPDALKAIYSPSHSVVVDRLGDYGARVGYEERDALPDKDFELIYTVSPEDVGLNLLSFRESGVDGFFLMLVAPKVETDPSEVVAKDVFLILDTSGSMEGEKIQQAREALIYVLEHLNQQDRFFITDFSTGVRHYAAALSPADERGEAISWVRSLEAGGGTDINRALLETVAEVDPERPSILIFLTDGQPTEGEVDADRIVANFAQVTRSNVRLFTFGVGDDVNTILLDRLAQEQRGASGYVRPGQRIDEEISAFYTKVSTPLLADIELEVEGVRVEDVYPYPLPDLFVGTQLVVVGRYREGGPAVVRLVGQVNGREQTFTYEDLRFENSGGEAFIPRLWATRKIGYLLNQIRLHGESSELVDEIVALSVRYGIVTPYTSYLVQEDADVWTEEGRDEIVAEEMYQLESTAAPAAGAQAVEKAVEQEAIRGADRAEAPSGEAAQVVKIVGNKTFVYRGGVWIDTTFDPSRMATRQVGFNSQSYYDLLGARPDLGSALSLGERVIVVVDEGLVYEVVEGDTGEVTLPPTPAPGTPVAQATDVPATEVPEEEESDPPTGLCPGAPLMGLILLPLALVSAGWRKRRG